MKKELVFIRIVGILLLLVGLLSLFCVPAEFTSLYGFIDGGDFHFEGFGFGSLMFAFIVFSGMVYASLALVCIPLGIGTLQLKRWGFTLSLAVLKAFLLLGLALTISLLFSFELWNNLEFSLTLTILLVVLLFFVALPFALIRVYKHPSIESLFHSSPKDPFENQHPDTLIIILLNLFWVFVLFLFVFFKGAFPFMGDFVFKKDGTYFLSMAIVALLVLSYFYYGNTSYARVGMIAFYLILFLTFAYTFVSVSTNEFIQMLDLPMYELEKVVPAFRIPAGINAGLFFGILLAMQTIVVLRSGKNRGSD